MTRSELQHALACEDVSEGLRTIVDDMWKRAETAERALVLIHENCVALANDDAPAVKEARGLAIQLSNAR